MLENNCLYYNIYIKNRDLTDKTIMILRKKCKEISDIFLLNDCIVRAENGGVEIIVKLYNL